MISSLKNKILKIFQKISWPTEIAISPEQKGLSRVPEPHTGQKSQCHRYLVWFFWRPTTYLPTFPDDHLRYLTLQSHVFLTLCLTFDTSCGKKWLNFKIYISWSRRSSRSRTRCLVGLPTVFILAAKFAIACWKWPVRASQIKSD